MKWMIASDLHGSAYYCKKMVEAFEREGAEEKISGILGGITSPSASLPSQALRASSPKGGALGRPVNFLLDA